jgi:hypothetical protein
MPIGSILCAYWGDLDRFDEPDRVESLADIVVV